MTNKEERLLNDVEERVEHCLKRGIEKGQIVEWLDDVIYDLNDNASPELYSMLYRIQDSLLLNRNN